MPKSTNPFDDSSDEESESDFYDCHEHEALMIDAAAAAATDTEQRPNNTNNKRRSANINFDNPFDDVEAPALDFSTNFSPVKFVSPLESAMMELGNNSTYIGTSHSNESSDEFSPLLTDDGGATQYSDLTSSTGTKERQQQQQQQRQREIIPIEIKTARSSLSSSSKKKKAQRPSVKIKPDIILKDLAGGENGEFSMDYKSILLEDLGTASSWLILLLPYIAFFVCLILESSSGIKAATTQSFSASMPCEDVIQGTPLMPSPTMPCHTYFQRNIESSRRELDLDYFTNKAFPYDGVAFESGSIDGLPILSTYFYGDAFFTELSTKAVALVARGGLESSVQVLQQKNNDITMEDQDWSVMFSSNTKTVSMACDKISSNNWDCKAPEIIDVIFSMPETAVYAGGHIRVNIFYSLKTNATETTLFDSFGNKTIDISHVYTKGKDAASLLSTVHIEDTNTLLDEIVASSRYTFDHMSYTASVIDTGVRLGCFLISFCFAIYWSYLLGIRTLFSSCGNKNRRNYFFPSSKTSTEWWESHWILFPERYYILMLLLCLFLVQEPVLAAMFFSPTLASSENLHIVADATIGIGVHGILFVYLCLFHGFRFHTASVTKKRAEHQRQILQLRRAAKYVNASENQKSPNEAAILSYTDNYYDLYGDIDGSISNNHRLENDPCGDDWADFLLPKLLLFSLGVASVISIAYCRFPPEMDEVVTLDKNSLNTYRTVYVISSIVQFTVLVFWMLAILKAAFDTGRCLKAEKFLSTRPVQLAYRIIFAHISLGLIVLLSSFGLRMHELAFKWSLDSEEDGIAQEDVSQIEMALRILSQVALTFPYSGTAASVGAGRVLFATVSILITAFIFLPAHSVKEEDESSSKHQNGGKTGVIKDRLQEQRRLKRDKRLVVHLAKDAKTWRVFPLPIDQKRATTMLEDNVFQLYKDLHTDENDQDRGVVSCGPYTPIFCLELACWLNEASWQAYYSPSGISSKIPGKSRGGMNLEELGLRMEGAVFDDMTDTQVFVATNIAEQVDGEEDSVIVVSFRGTDNLSNLQTDLRSRQIPLLDQLAGTGSAPFCIHPDRLEVYDEDGWIWNTPKLHGHDVQCVTSWPPSRPFCLPSHCSRQKDPSPLQAVSEGARAILQATPVARDSFPLVHEGFQEVYTHIRKKLLDILFPVMQRQLSKSLKTRGWKDESEPLALPKIYATGHSLGGSLAQLLALDLACNCEIVLPTKVPSSNVIPLETTPENEVFQLPHSYQQAKTTISSADKVTVKELRLQPPVAVYTFGQPRVGNKQFSRFYKEKVPHSFRVVNEGDAITSMPNRYFCGGVYKHSGLEVLLDEGMTGNILVGPTVVETLFRFSPVRTSMLAHTMTRYRDCLECAFEEHELLEYYQGHNVSKTETQKGNTKQIRVSKTEIPEWLTQVGTRKK